jgi:hypothetical protein
MLFVVFTVAKKIGEVLSSLGFKLIFRVIEGFRTVHGAVLSCSTDRPANVLTNIEEFN